MYSSTLLDGVNKVGDLKKDNDGYYDMVLGAFNAYNAHGDYYPLGDIKTIMDNDELFQRRLLNRALGSEVDHPKPFIEMTYKNLTEAESKRLKERWFERVLTIDEQNMCAHISKVVFSENTISDKSGRPLIAVIGKIKPSGIHERFLERQLENRHENVCFSIRCFTLDKFIGSGWVKEVKKIVTWDKVREPGIEIANKFMSPSLESIYKGHFTLDELKDFGNSNTLSNLGISTESSDISAKSVANELIGFVTEVKIPTKVFVPRNYSNMRNWK